MHMLDQIWPFWPKIPNPYGMKQKFGIHVMEKPPTHIVRIFFWSAMGPKPKPPRQLNIPL